MDAFKKDGVVSDVIDNTPPTCLTVKYGDVEVKPGQVFTPTQVKETPTIQYEASSDDFYSIIMNDPDAPSRADPKFGEYHHWLVVNIPGNDVKQGEEVTQYIGSGPPKDTGLHRYVFLLFKQDKGKITLSELPQISKTSSKGRPKHKARDFAAKFGLSLVAGNFYQAEYDDYVPTLHAQLASK